MNTKEIEVNGKKFTISEIKYRELTSFANLEKGEAAKKIMLVSTGMTEEDYDNLSIKEGIFVQKEINELNGLDDFQNPPTK